MENKSVTFINQRGEHTSYSAEQLLSKSLNQWQGWYCSAGYDHLCIDNDGDVYIGACRLNGSLGNLYREDVQLPNDYVFCTKKWCHCGSDMALRKVKNKKDIPYTLLAPLKEMEDVKEASIVQAYQQWITERKTLIWETGRRCNYKCSYCPPGTSNTTDSHKSLDTLLKAAHWLFDHFCDEYRTKFIFSGGEPTINPGFLDLVKTIQARVPQKEPEFPHCIHTTTNGSRQEDYYLELLKYSHIGVSIHFEFFNEERFVKKIKNLIEAKHKYSDYDRRLFSIRIMVPPGQSERALNLSKNLKSLPYFLEESFVNLCPIIDFSVGAKEQLLPYEPNELAEIEAHG